jgi:hypothetical protein
MPTKEEIAYMLRELNKLSPEPDIDKQMNEYFNEQEQKSER